MNTYKVANHTAIDATQTCLLAVACQWTHVLK